MYGIHPWLSVLWCCSTLSWKTTFVFVSFFCPKALDLRWIPVHRLSGNVCIAGVCSGTGRPVLWYCCKKGNAKCNVALILILQALCQFTTVYLFDLCGNQRCAPCSTSASLKKLRKTQTLYQREREGERERGERERERERREREREGGGGREREREERERERERGEEEKWKTQREKGRNRNRGLLIFATEVAL